MARYGRQDIHSWENRPISDLNEAVAALSELMEKENALTAQREDR